MIAKKKGLYLGLLLSMLGIGNAIQAYTVVLKNGTPYSIKFKADFIACKDDHGELASGHSLRIGAGACLLRAVNATVYEAPMTLDPTLSRRQTREVKAKRYYAPAGRAGGTFLITGPYGTGEMTSYIVTREVN